MDYYKAVQFFFYTQWNALKAYANGKGIQLVGDIPIYVSPDSSDLWTHPELFQTDGDVHLTSVAGCPPDAFAADGQLWGNPLYDWPRHKAEDFAWWKRRMQARHFHLRCRAHRPFPRFRELLLHPRRKQDRCGRPLGKGPGPCFHRRHARSAGRGRHHCRGSGLPDPEVKAMLAASGYPGMKIMQFAFDSREPGNYLPYTYPATAWSTPAPTTT